MATAAAADLIAQSS